MPRGSNSMLSLADMCQRREVSGRTYLAQRKYSDITDFLSTDVRHTMAF
jgi:hypothetical protein